MSHNFFDEKLTTKNIANYYMRKSILRGLEDQKTLLHGHLLDVGCGQMPYRKHILDTMSVLKYTGLDIDTAIEYNKEIQPDARWDGNIIPFEDAQFDCVLLTEVLEHSFDPQRLLQEVARILKPGGVVVFTMPFMWPLHETPHDAHRYTPYAIEKNFLDVGFSSVDVLSGGCWHASLAQMLGLWAGRAPLKKWQKKIAAIVLIPVMKYLLKKDQEITHTFGEQQMYTNFYGNAKK